MHLGTAGSLRIVGPNANLILCRLCVRALVPIRFGGLDSSNVMIANAGNKSDLNQIVSFARQYHMNIDNTLDRIIVNRPFTTHQLKRRIATCTQKRTAVSSQSDHHTGFTGLIWLRPEHQEKRSQASNWKNYDIDTKTLWKCIGYRVYARRQVSKSGCIRLRKTYNTYKDQKWQLISRTI